MYCKHCGKFIDENSSYCTYCGTRLNSNEDALYDEHFNWGFAILGFLIPILGLILFIIYEKKNPKKASAAIKGVIAKIITKIVIFIILIILYATSAFSLLNTITDKTASDLSVITNSVSEETPETLIKEEVSNELSTDIPANNLSENEIPETIFSETDINDTSADDSFSNGETSADVSVIDDSSNTNIYESYEDLLDSTSTEFLSDLPSTDSLFSEETTADILDKYADITFGNFKTSNDGYYTKTSLDVTLKNKSDSRYTFIITIEAVDSSGARLGIDTIYADRLNAGQEIFLNAFTYINREKIDQFQNATFKVLDIKKYDF